MANRNLSNNRYSRNDLNRVSFATLAIFSRIANVDRSSRPVESRKGIVQVRHCIRAVLYLKDPEKRARNRESYMKDQEKSCADSAARSRESYKNDLEKSRDDSAARSRESYLKVPEKRHARNRESYMKHPEKSHADSAARSHES